jgi:hypothetical protein
MLLGRAAFVVSGVHTREPRPAGVMLTYLLHLLFRCAGAGPFVPNPAAQFTSPVGVLPNALVHWLIPYAAARLTLSPGLGSFHVGCEGKTY